jgi:hypothetical protein
MLKGLLALVTQTVSELPNEMTEADKSEIDTRAVLLRACGPLSIHINDSHFCKNK